MKANVGKMDRFFRIILSIPFLVYGVMHSSFIGLIGVALLATALLKWCGLYTILGFSTNCSADNTDCKLKE
ncbi:MAG: DUF2892 domain-containing protein [Sulfurospirillum sp.]|nr:DUF2892 domain-containing protein [Sulfurospirillum sp.]